MEGANSVFVKKIIQRILFSMLVQINVITIVELIVFSRISMSVK